MIFQILLCCSFIQMIKGYCSSDCDCCVKVDEIYQCETINYCLRILWIWFGVWLIITIGYIYLYFKRRQQTKFRIDRISEISLIALRQQLFLSQEKKQTSVILSTPSA